MFLTMSNFKKHEQFIKSSLLAPTYTVQSPTQAKETFNPSSSDTQENLSSSLFITDTRETINPNTTITTGAVIHYLQGTHNLAVCYHLLIGHSFSATIL